MRENFQNKVIDKDIPWIIAKKIGMLGLWISFMLAFISFYVARISGY